MSEITVLRGQYTKVFQTGEGQFEQRIYAAPIHYSEEGSWHEFSLEYEEREHYGWKRICFEHSPLKVRIGDNPTTESVELLELQSGDHWITIKVTEPTSAVAPIIDGGVIRYPRLAEDADFEIRVDPGGQVSRRWIIYKDLDTFPEFQDSVLLSTNLRIQENEDGSLLLHDGKDGIFHFLPPFLESSRGTVLNEGIKYHVGKDGRYQTVIKVLSKKAIDWIEKEFEDGASWVVVDPTIKIPSYVDSQTVSTINIKKDSTGPIANEAHSTNKYFIVGISGNVTNDPRWRILWKPNLADAQLQAAASSQIASRIPRGAKLDLLRAYLQFFNSARQPSGALAPGSLNPDNNIDVYVYRILKDWDTYGTWNRPKNDVSLPTWDGCPNDGINSAINSSANAVWVSDATFNDTLPALEVTSDVQAFLDGTLTNYGWVLKELGEDTATDQFYTPNSEGSVSTDPTLWDYKEYRPYLSLQYAFTLTSPSVLDANPDSATSIVLNVTSAENREDYTILYSRTDAGNYAELVKLAPREKVYQNTSLVATSTYRYKARHQNELRAIGWPEAPAGQITLHKLESNADGTFSFKPSAVANGTVTLPPGASGTNEYYTGWEVYVYSGTGAQGQTRTVSAYVGATRVATLSSNWAVNPDTDSVVLFRPYIPPAFGSADTSFPNATNNYDYKVNIDSVSGGAIQTVSVFRKRSHETAWGTAIHTVSPPATSPSWTTVNDSANLKIRLSSNTGFVAGDVNKYWTISCYGGWSEYSPEATVSATWAAPGAYAGSYVVGGSGRDMDLDDWPTSEGFQDTEIAGPSEQQYVQLEGQNFAFDHVGSYITGVKDLGLGATLEIVKFSKTDVDSSMTLKSRVDTSYIETVRDSSVTPSNAATIEVRSSDTVPIAKSGWTSWSVTDSAENTAWDDKSYPSKWDAVWGMDQGVFAQYEAGNFGNVMYNGSTYTVTAGSASQCSRVAGTGGNPDQITRGFFSIDISEIHLEELSNRAHLIIPHGGGSANISLYVVDWGDTLVSGAYTQAPDWGTTDSLVWSGINNNALDGYSSCTVIKTPAFRNALIRLIRDQKKYMRIRFQLSNEAVVTSAVIFTIPTLKIYYKLITPFVQLIHNQRVPSSLRKRFVQMRSTIWRGHSSSE